MLQSFEDASMILIVVMLVLTFILMFMAGRVGKAAGQLEKMNFMQNLEQQAKAHI